MTGDVFGYDQLQRAALGFVLETETWPVFLAWLREQHASAAAHNWIVAGPDLEAWRDEWAARCISADVRALNWRGGDNEHRNDASAGRGPGPGTGSGRA